MREVRYTALKGAIKSMACATALVLSACASGSAQSLPDEFLGRWYYTGSSGGISGGGMGDDATGYIVINADNSMESYAEDGTLVDRQEFAVGFGETIFSTEPQWMLNPGSGMPRAIRVFDEGRVLTISENVYDGFSRGYVRER